MSSLAARRALAAALLCFAVAACEPQPAGPAAGHGRTLFANAPSVEWRLPNRLREISGLAVTPDGRVFGHGDERAELYEIDVVHGRVGKSFSLGNPPERGDFEDIAITPDGDFWLTTSRGKLYRFREGENGAAVDFVEFNSGLKDVCEIEGLEYLASARSLIIACKVNSARDMRHTLALYQWPIASNGPATLWRSLPEETVTRAAGVREFRPSSVKLDPATGRILLLSARDGALAELTPDGELIAARRLGSEHVQAEGMTVLQDGSLAIADEAAGGTALLAVYGRVQ